MALGKQHRLRVCRADAGAIRRALAAEVPVEVFPERVTCLYFDREGLPLLHRARRRPDELLHVRAWVRSAATERAVLEVLEARGEAIEVQRLEVPREALRRTLRSHATSELLPSLPTGLLPSLRVTFLRERYSRGQWEVCLDRELAFRVEGSCASREREAVVTLTWWDAPPPEWLRCLSRGFAPYDVYREGMSRLEQTPGLFRSSARLRLGDWAEALEA